MIQITSNLDILRSCRSTKTEDEYLDILRRPLLATEHNELRDSKNIFDNEIYFLYFIANKRWNDLRYALLKDIKIWSQKMNPVEFQILTFLKEKNFGLARKISSTLYRLLDLRNLIPEKEADFKLSSKMRYSSPFQLKVNLENAFGIPNLTKVYERIEPHKFPRRPRKSSFIPGTVWVIPEPETRRNLFKEAKFRGRKKTEQNRISKFQFEERLLRTPSHHLSKRIRRKRKQA